MVSWWIMSAGSFFQNGGILGTIEAINVVLEIGLILDNTAEMIRIVDAFTTELSQQSKRKLNGWVCRIRNKMFITN